METALPGIWAAGDCTESLDVSCGEAGVLAVLPNASFQGRTAGVNMAGGEAVFDTGMKMNSIGFFGLHIMSAGTYTDLIYSEVTDTGCKKLFAKQYIAAAVKHNVMIKQDKQALFCVRVDNSTGRNASGKIVCLVLSFRHRTGCLNIADLTNGDFGYFVNQYSKKPAVLFTIDRMEGFVAAENIFHCIFYLLRS